MQKSPVLATSINLKPVELREAKISVLDRGFLYGDSVYEVIRTYQLKLFTYDRHIQRLRRSAELIYMQCPWSDEAIRQHMQDMIASLTDKFNEAYIRLVLSRGEGPIDLDPIEATQPNLCMIFKEAPQYPAAYKIKGIKTIIPSIRRNLRTALDPAIKSGNYLNNILALNEARKQNAVEAIMLDFAGRITEGTTSNIYIVKNGTTYTPPFEDGILAGITREIILELAEQNKMIVKQTSIYPQDLFEADECFISSTTREIMPVQQCGENKIGEFCPGPVTQQLMDQFHKITSAS